MYEESCSSSTTIILRFWHGANTHDLAPTATRDIPWRKAHQFISLSLSGIPECRTTASGNLDFILLSKNVVSEISGRRYMAEPLSLSLSLETSLNIALRYTSVFPLPVTPCMRNFLYLTGSVMIFDSAFSCSLVSVKICSLPMFPSILCFSSFSYHSS